MDSKAPGPPDQPQYSQEMVDIIAGKNRELKNLGDQNDEGGLHGEAHPDAGVAVLPPHQPGHEGQERGGGGGAQVAYPSAP